MRNDRNEVLEGPFSRLMADLREARYQDETVNVERPRWRNRAGCSCGLLILTGFYGGGVCLAYAFGGGDPLTRFGPLVMLLLWLSFWSKVHEWAQNKTRMYDLLDLDDRKLRVVTRLLDQLEVDLDPEANQRLELNLKVTTEDVFKNGDLVREPEPWLTADLRLQDGRKLYLSVSRGFKRKTRQKRRTGLKVRGRIWDVIEISANPLPPLEQVPAPPFGLHLSQNKYDPQRQMRQMRLITDRAMMSLYDGAQTFPADQLAHEKRLLQALIYFFAARAPRSTTPEAEAKS